MDMQFDTPTPFPPSKSFAILALLNLAFIYAKLTVNLYIRWTLILSPLTLFFAIKFINSILKLNKRLTKTGVLWNLCQILITAPLGVATFYLGILIEKINDQQDIQEPLKHLFACIAFALLVYALYAFKVANQQNQPNGVIMNFILSSFGNTINFCSGGACNSFYMSTLSTFFSAFGISIAQYIHYLNYICVILLSISLLSLYSVKRSPLYAPFLLTVVGSSLIFMDMFIYDYDYANYAGNILVIGAAIWNSQLDKFKFGSKRNFS